MGVSALLIAYLLMVGSGLRVAVRSQRSFTKLLATGFSLLMAVQVFVVVGGITRLIPITGYHTSLCLVRRIVPRFQLHPARHLAPYFERQRH